DQERRAEAKQLCRAMCERAAPAVERLLRESFASDSDQLMDTAADVLGRDPARDSEQMFDWRLRITATGKSLSSIYQVPELAKSNHERGLRLFRAWLQNAFGLI